MRKLTTIVVALGTTWALAACGSSQPLGPEATVDRAMQAMANGKTSEMAKYFQCPQEALTGVVMAKAFGMDVEELAKGAKTVGKATLSDGGAKATVDTTGPFGDDTQELVKVNAKGNLAPTNGTWKLACDEDAK